MVMVLIITSVLFGGALFALKLAKDTTQSSAMLLDKFQARLEAEGIFEKIKYFASTGRFLENRIRSPLLRHHGLPRTLYLDNRKIRLNENATIRLMDSAGLLDLWSVDPDILERVLKLKGLPSEEVKGISDSIRDWTDSGHLKRLHGGEKYFYQMDEQLVYEPRNYGAWQSKYELSLVKGFLNTPAWKLIEPHVIAAIGPSMNINTMNEQLLTAVLDIDKDQAAELLSKRKSENGLSLSDLKTVTHADVFASRFQLTTYPSKKLVVRVAVHQGRARETVRALLDCNALKTKPYTVQEYVR